MNIRGQKAQFGKKSWLTLFFVVVIFGGIFWGKIQSSAATPPSSFVYQGKLLVNGSAATTTQSIIFSLYTSSSGGTPVYTASGTIASPQPLSVTPSTGGLFDVTIGGSGSNTLDSGIFQNNSSLYLQVQVGSEVLSPRKQLTSAPFSLNSEYLNGIAATSTASSSTYIPVSDSSGNFAFNHVTSTGLTATGASTLATTTASNLSVTGAGTLGSLNVTGSSSLATTTISSSTIAQANVANLNVSSGLALPNNSITDAMVTDSLTIGSGGNVNASAINSGTLGSSGVTLAFGSFGTISGQLSDSNISDALTINGGAIDNTPIGATTASTAIFTNATSSVLAATTLNGTNATLTAVTSTALTVTNLTGSGNINFTGATFTGLSSSNLSDSSTLAYLANSQTFSGNNIFSGATSLATTTITSSTITTANLGTANVSGDLAVGGNSTLTGTLGVSGTSSLATTTASNLNVSGAAAFGSLNVSGPSSLATITSGTWNGTTIGTVYGGTGQDTSGWNGLLRVTGGTWSTSTISTADLTDSSTLAYLANSQTFSGNNIFNGATSLATTTLSGFSTGSLLFSGSGGQISQDNSQLFWDDTKHYLGIGETPTEALDVNGSASFGSNTSASGTDAMAFGTSSEALGDYSFAGGYNSIALSTGTVAIGYGNNAYGLRGMALGTSNYVTSSFAFGYNNFASSSASYAFAPMALGTSNTADGAGAISFGFNNVASGGLSMSLGSNNTERGGSSIVLGNGNIATGTESLVLGNNNTISGDYAVAAGNNAIVTGNYSFGINVSSTVVTTSQANVITLTGGNVGINTTAPSTALTVVGTSTLQDVIATGALQVSGASSLATTTIADNNSLCFGADCNFNAIYDTSAPTSTALVFGMPGWGTTTTNQVVFGPKSMEETSVLNGASYLYPLLFGSSSSILSVASSDTTTGSMLSMVAGDTTATLYTAASYLDLRDNETDLSIYNASGSGSSFNFNGGDVKIANDKKLCFGPDCNFDAMYDTSAPTSTLLFFGTPGWGATTTNAVFIGPKNAQGLGLATNIRNGQGYQQYSASSTLLVLGSEDIVGGSPSVAPLILVADDSTSSIFGAKNLILNVSGGSGISIGTSTFDFLSTHSNGEFSFTGSNVGIGTTTPSTLLTVAGTSTLENTIVQNDKQVCFGQDCNFNALYDTSAPTSSLLFFGTPGWGATTDNVIVFGPKVGQETAEGTNFRDYLTYGLADTSSTILSLLPYSSSPNSNPLTFIADENTSTIYGNTNFLLDNQGGSAIAFNSSTSIDFVINNNNYHPGNEFNFSGGYVGIGTSTPSTLLTVAGTSTLQDTVLQDGKKLCFDGGCNFFATYDTSIPTSTLLTVGLPGWGTNIDNAIGFLPAQAVNSGMAGRVRQVLGTGGITASSSMLFIAPEDISNSSAAPLFLVADDMTSTVLGANNLTLSDSGGDQISIGGAATGGFNFYATNNHKFTFSNGNVGIGSTSTPSYLLTVDSGNPNSTAVGVIGNIIATGYITGTTTVDLAETYPIDPSCSNDDSCPAPGDDVCLSTTTPGAVAKCSNPDQSILGIVSTNPGFTLGGLSTTSSRRIALAGRVPLRVSLANGPINVGDLLTTSNIPGLAVKATAPGPTVAMALAPLSGDSSATGTITAFVKLGWSDATSLAPTTTTTALNPLVQTVLDGLKQLGVDIENGIVTVQKFVANLIQAQEVDTNKLNAQEFCVNGTCINQAQFLMLLQKNGLAPSDSGASAANGSSLVQPSSSSTGSTTTTTTSSSGTSTSTPTTTVTTTTTVSTASSTINSSSTLDTSTTSGQTSTSTITSTTTSTTVSVETTTSTAPTSSIPSTTSTTSTSSTSGQSTTTAAPVSSSTASTTP